MSNSTPTVVVSGRKKMRDDISDHCGIGLVALWEENVNSLVVGKLCMLKNLLVKEYACIKSLSVAKDECEIVEMEGLGEIKQESKDTMNTNLNGEVMMMDATVIAVPELDSY